jgi:hypothetical protein
MGIIFMNFLPFCRTETRYKYPIHGVIPWKFRMRYVKDTSFVCNAPCLCQLPTCHTRLLKIEIFLCSCCFGFNFCISLFPFPAARLLTHFLIVHISGHYWYRLFVKNNVPWRSNGSFAALVGSIPLQAI